VSFKLDPSGEKILSTVHKDLQAITRLATKLSSKPFTIIQGKRTPEYQRQLYNIGRRGIPGEKPVTWTLKSKHLSGRAIDFAPLVNGKPSYNEKLYPPSAATFQAAAKQLGLRIVWGGNWKVRDWGHIQVEPDQA
jgi:peptidoglycan L-alanyl-D-glutamate endopeptidase CwlK